MNRPEIPFVAFGKITRHRRSIVITEKIDGSNASVFIAEDGQVYAGSRNRWITPEDDNYGFARWVDEHTEELKRLGPGHHFGEWWGPGIQRRYNLTEKRFSLFNTSRWGDGLEKGRPACCHVVPILYVGQNTDTAINEVLDRLRTCGSVAAPNFMNPEGIVVYHSASRSLSKITLDRDEIPKGTDILRTESP